MSQAETRLPIFSERFSELRKEAEKTQGEFAEHIGIARATVGFYESGERFPDAVVLSKICTACDVSSDYLLGLSGHRNYNNRGITAADLRLSEHAIEALQKDNGIVDMQIEEGAINPARMVSIVNWLIEAEATGIADLRLLSKLQSYNKMCTDIGEADERTILKIVFGAVFSLPFSEQSPLGRFEEADPGDTERLLERLREANPGLNATDLIDNAALNGITQSVKAFRGWVNESAGE